MKPEQLLSDLRITNGDGVPKLFQEYLADYNILMIRRVPVPSHGPATKFLQSLLADNRGAEEMTVRGFDIRSPDKPCEACQSPHIVYTGPNLTTICDGDGSILQQFGVVGYDRFYVVRSVPQVLGDGSIEVIIRSELHFSPTASSPGNLIARAPPADYAA